MTKQRLQLSSQRNAKLGYEDIVKNFNSSVTHLDFSAITLTKPQLEDLEYKISENSYLGHITWGELPCESEEFIVRIEEKLIQNNKNYKSYPTDFIHSLLSSHSYQTASAGNEVKFTVNSKGAPHDNIQYNQYLEDWIIKKVFQPDNSDDYYSVLYVNHKDRQAVLAHRGTDILGSLKGVNKSLEADLIEILNRNIGVQQAASYVSTQESLEIVQQLGYNFSTTGHSLGAWLAELSLYFCHRNFKFHKVKSVTFDSPGSKDQIDTYKSNVHNSDTKISKNQFDMVTYLSAPNIVNTCNEHFGLVHRIHPEIKYPEFLKGELIPAKLPNIVKNALKTIISSNKFYLDALLSVSGHSLTPMIHVFDPKTGKPYLDKYSKVLDWPHIKHIPNTKHIQNANKEIIIDNLPIIKSLPNFVKSGGVNILSNLIPNNTLSSVSSVLASFLCGTTEISQLCETFRHFDLDTYKEGYKVQEELSTLNKFALHYKAHYTIETVNPLRCKLLTKYKGSTDWYISQLSKRTYKQLETLDKMSCKQLQAMKASFAIKLEENAFYLSTKWQSCLTAEQLKQYFSRLIEVNPVVKKFFDERTTCEPWDSFTLSTNKIAAILPNKINNFVGRSEVFDKIDNILSQYQIVAINAFAGMGKSSTALEYGHLAQNEGKIVRWFDAGSPEKIQTCYKQFAFDLGVEVGQQQTQQEGRSDAKETKKDSAVEQRQKIINSVNNAIVKLDKPILLIFDNLELLQDAAEYLNNLPKNLVKVILTTRDSKLLDNPQQHIILEPFGQQDAEEYIKLNLGVRTTPEKTKELIATLGNGNGEVLPFRLSKAVAYLKQNPLCSIQKYIEIVKNSDEHAETSLLIDSLKDAPLELQILQYAAFLDPDSINIEIFKELLQIDEDQLQSAVSNLQKLSLLQLNYDDNGHPYLKMHRLAQNEIIKYTNSTYNQTHQQLLPTTEVQQNLITTFNELMPLIDNNSTDKTQELVTTYYPHIHKIENNCEKNSIERGQLCEKLGDYNYYTCKYHSAVIYHLKSLAIYQILRDNYHADIVRASNNVAIAYDNLGKPSKALQHYKTTLKLLKTIYENTNNGNHPEVADTLFNIGAIYERLAPDASNTRKASKYYEQALSMWQKLNAQNNYQQEIATVSYALGKICVKLQYENVSNKTQKKAHYQENYYDKADEYFDNALKLWQVLYKDNSCHPKILKSLNSSIEVKDKLINELAKKTKYYGIPSLGSYYEDEYDYESDKYRLPLLRESNLKHKQQLLSLKTEIHKSKISYVSKYEIANLSLNLAHSFKSLKLITKAIEHYEQALKLWKKTDKLEIVNCLIKLGQSYQEVKYNSKALELYKQAYYFSSKQLGEKHSYTQKAIKKILKLDPKFTKYNEFRILILERDITNENILNVKQQIQKNILNKIHQLAAKSDWSSGAVLSSPSILGDWGIKGYFAEKFLKNKLGNLSNVGNLKVAQMLCFEAMCLGVMSTKNKDMNCIKEFVKEYPQIMQQIIEEHPEYMVDGSIVRICVSDPVKLKHLLGENHEENFRGQGNSEVHIQSDPWMEYTKEGMSELLKLRLESLESPEAQNIEMIIPDYVYDGTKENAQKLANEICSNLEEKTAVVLNLFGKHWVGLVITKNNDIFNAANISNTSDNLFDTSLTNTSITNTVSASNTLDIQYMDSEQEKIPQNLLQELLQQLIIKYPEYDVLFTETELTPQQYNNCGPELIENLILYLGTERITSQEDTVAIHSALLENSLSSLYNSTDSII